MNVRVNILLIKIYIFTAILYYFLRFQFGLDEYVLYFFGLLQFIISAKCTLLLYSKSHRFSLLNPLDTLSLLLLLHTIFLLFLTVIRAENTYIGLLYSIKDYLFPVVFFWFCRFSISEKDILPILKLKLLVLSAVSVIVIGEYVKWIETGGEYFHYTYEVREKIAEKTKSPLESVTPSIFNERDYGFSWVRMEGPLSHNNSTGLAVGLSIITSFFFTFHLNSKRFFILFLLNVVAMILLLPRTSMFATITGLAILLWANRKDYTLYTKYLFVLFFSFGIIFIIYGISNWGISAYLLSYEGLTSPLVAIANGGDVDLFMSSLISPLTFFGRGFPVPGEFHGPFSIVRSDDVFIIQLLSMYGLLFVVYPLSFFLIFRRNRLIYFRLIGIQRRKRNTVVSYENGFPLFFLSCLVVCGVSTIHANSIIRPQLIHLPMLYLSICSILFFRLQHRAKEICERSHYP